MVLQKFKKDSNGQALVEFALVLPILVMLVMGIIQFGIILNGFISVTHAAREGVRLAVVGETDENVKEIVLKSAKTVPFINITLDNIEIDEPSNHDNVTNPIPTRNIGDTVTVLIKDASVQNIIPFIAPITGNTIPLAASSSMMVEKGYRAGVDVPKLIDLEVSSLILNKSGNDLRLTVIIKDDEGNLVSGVDVGAQIKEVDMGWVTPENPVIGKTNLSGSIVLDFKQFFNKTPNEYQNFIVLIQQVSRSGYSWDNIYPELLFHRDDFS